MKHLQVANNRNGAAASSTIDENDAMGATGKKFFDPTSAQGPGNHGFDDANANFAVEDDNNILLKGGAADNYSRRTNGGRNAHKIDLDGGNGLTNEFTSGTAAGHKPQFMNIGPAMTTPNKHSVVGGDTARNDVTKLSFGKSILEQQQ